uniref:CSLF3-cellulose synthase-like family F n=1 Tax=Arundo donax TaxID=35708 RepID=A0A0A8YWZ4_ARUDO
MQANVQQSSHHKCNRKQDQEDAGLLAPASYDRQPKRIEEHHDPRVEQNTQRRMPLLHRRP